MKVKTLLIVLSIFSPISLLAHQVPVAPVRIQFHVERYQIRANIVMDSEYWMAEVLDLSSPPPPTNWAPIHQEASARAINQSLILAVDGSPLRLATLTCRYIEEPLQLVPPRFEFSVVYDMPVNGRVLSGTVQFFKEEYGHYLKTQRPTDQSFFAHVEFSGRTKLQLDIPFEKPDFELELEKLRKTNNEYFSETFRLSTVYFLFTSLLPFYGLALFLSALTFPLRRKIVLISVLLAGAVVTLWFGKALPVFGSVVLWAFVGVLFLPKILMTRLGKWDPVVVVMGCLVAWPSLFYMTAAQLPFSVDESPAIRLALLGSFLFSLGAYLLLFRFTVEMYDRFLRKRFGDTAPRLFRLDVRALSGFLLFLALMQMIKFYILK